MKDAPFDRDASAPLGAAQEVAPGVRRVIAPNPSPMTFTGTASYLVGRRRVALIDPGPEDAAHSAALLEAVGPDAEVAAILVTHGHRDHSAGAAALKAATGAPVLGFGAGAVGMSARMRALAASGATLGGGEGADPVYAPDAVLADGEIVESPEWRLRALHMPGHRGDHLCFALEGTGTLFSGDLVMAWSTTLVSPPDGDITDFLASLARLRARAETLYLPGHGPALRDPHRMIDWQIAHRAERRGQILAALASGSATPRALTEAIYADIDRALWPAAERNVLAHLLGLMDEGLVGADGPPGPRSAYALVGGSTPLTSSG
ncbi:MAG: MBL fold metallo-hydrolase [Rubrimonas sp.]